jgi:hypothetical protein
MGISSIFYKENSGMIRLNINPKVLISLQAAFPKPEHSAEKALNKYSELLEDYFEQAMLGGFSMWSNAGFAYCISLHKLANKGPTIGSKKNSTKIRVHKWLVDNNLSLFSLVKKGGIFGDEKGNSYIATSPLVELEFYDPKYRSEIEFKKRHPDFENLTKNQIHTDYDRLQIDIGSLRNYIHRLVRNPNKSSSFLRVYNQALKVSAIASYQPSNVNAKNMFFQKKKPSQFGRTYYEGINVQSVKRELRKAILGNCFEYDMRSSVVAWKLGYAQGYITANNFTGTVKTVFPQCYQYWLDKKILIDKIRKDVFLNNKIYSIDEEIALMKDALTALNFGAVLIDVKDKEYAIKKILSSPYDKITYGKFRKNYYVKAFSSEQKKLDKYILQIEKANNPSLLTNPILQTSTKRIKNSSILSYLYQHAETEVMDIFRNHARINKLTILANVHDAIYLRYKLSNSLFRQITNDIHSISGNTYWFLNETQHHRVT